MAWSYITPGYLHQEYIVFFCACSVSKPTYRCFGPIQNQEQPRTMMTILDIVEFTDHRSHHHTSDITPQWDDVKVNDYAWTGSRVFNKHAGSKYNTMYLYLPRDDTIWVPVFASMVIHWQMFESWLKTAHQADDQTSKDRRADAIRGRDWV